MELVKDIYFNTDKLIENTNIKVSYTGKFYQGNNEKVYLHYGYGKDWNNINEIEMKKTDLGYQAELKLCAGETLNFCFKNQNNEWDNNFGKNYIFNIEKKAQNAKPLNQKKAEAKQPGSNEPCAKKVSNPYCTFGNIENKNISNDTQFNEVKTSVAVNENTSGIIEDVINNNPNSVDKIISKKTGSVLEFSTIKPVQQENTVGNGFNIITPEFKKPQVASVDIFAGNAEFTGVIGETNPIQNIQVGNNIKNNIVNTPTNNAANNPMQKNVNNANTGINTNVINPFAKKAETAIALAPSGFEAWTKKVKNTVCKFFAYVPKFISGNFKRDLTKKQ